MNNMRFVKFNLIIIKSQQGFTIDEITLIDT